MKTSEDNNYRIFWDGYNNIGIGAVALATVMNEVKSLSISKSLLILPLVIHQPTLQLLSHKRTTFKGSASFVSTYPRLLTNFNRRYFSTLPLTLNSIQILINLNYLEFNENIELRKILDIDKEFGERAIKISKAANKISELLEESEEELYLNFRVKL